MPICETCGKEIKRSEVFTVNGKTQCEMCANSAPCSVCGKMLKPEEKCRKDGRIICRDCFKAQQKQAAENPQGVKHIVINERYEDDVMKYLMREAPTEDNNKRKAKTALLVSVGMAALAAFNLFLGIKMTAGFYVVAAIAMAIAVISAVVAVRAHNRKPEDNTLYQKYYHAYRHPVFGTADKVQEIINDISNNAVYADREIAFSNRYFVLRDKLTSVMKTEDIIAVTNIAKDEHTGSYIRYLLIFTNNGERLDVRYLKNADDSISAAIAALSGICYNALCAENPQPLSSKLPESIRKYLADGRNTRHQAKADEKPVQAVTVENKEEAAVKSEKTKRGGDGTVVMSDKYEMDDLSYIEELRHSLYGVWQQYDVLLAARGYGWDTILDWADYMAKEDLMAISKLATAEMPGMPETDLADTYQRGDRFSDMEALKQERGMFTVGGISNTLGAPVQIVWLNQTRVMRFFTLVDNDERMTRYIETVIRRSFHTPNAMKLAKPVKPKNEE